MGMNNDEIDHDKEEARNDAKERAIEAFSTEPETDQADMIQFFAREMLKNELKLKVEKEGLNSFSLHLELGGKVIPNSFVVLTLDAGVHEDDIDFEVV